MFEGKLFEDFHLEAISMKIVFFISTKLSWYVIERWQVHFAVNNNNVEDISSHKTR